MPLHKPVSQTTDQMREVAEDLAKCAADLLGISVGIQQSGFSELAVTHYDQIRRAREYVDNYVHAAKKALRDAREERQDFASPLKKKSGKRSPKVVSD